MPRHGRIEIIGGVYHIIARGIDRSMIFREDADRREFVRRLSGLISKSGTVCYGWVLMPNHFHLILRMGKTPISRVMRQLLTGYALYYNKKHKRRGYLFQNRYKSILCQEDAYLLELIRYVHLNPVRAGIVDYIDKLKHYEWSGYRVLSGKGTNEFQETEEILRMFSSKSGQALAQLETFMRDGLKQGKRDDLSGGGLRRSAGGWEGVMALKRAKEYWRGDERMLGDGEFVGRMLKDAEQELTRKEAAIKDGIDFNKLQEWVCKKYRIDKKDLRKKGRNNSLAKAKAVLAFFGYRELGISANNMARELQCSQAAISMLVKRGEEIVESCNVILLS